MTPEYQSILSEIRSQFADAGFCLTADSDFWAEFQTTDGWKLIFEGERYYGPLIDIKVIPPDEELGYSVYKLMDCFCKATGEELGPPSALNQANFVKEHFRTWISDTENYDAAYRAIHEKY